MNFLDIPDEYSSLDTSAAVILPVPYEKTTSYGHGTSLGPEAILQASAFVELYDEVYDTEVYKQGIHTAQDCVFTGETIRDFDSITQAAFEFVKKDKFVVALGGEHSISFPLYRAFHQKYNNLSVLHFDAHSDLRDSYENSKYSHAAVLSRIFELNKSIVQVGIRSQCIEEARFIKEYQIRSFCAHTIKKDGFNNGMIQPLHENVYITFDVDFFDPSIMPATGTPEPGGFFWDETILFLEQVFKDRNVVGCDVVELSPLEGLSFPNFLAAKLVYKLITMKFTGKK